MNSASVLAPFYKLLSLCERNNILSVEKYQSAIVNIKYGPLGCLLRKNIFREWLAFSLYNTDVHILPVHSHEVSAVANESESGISTKAVASEILHHYRDVFPLCGQQLPFGLSVYKECELPQESDELFNHYNTEVKEDSQFLWKLKNWAYLSIAFFCTANKSTSWFHYWQRQRYVWWRKFSAIPSQFCMSDIIQNDSSGQELYLKIDLPWGSKKLESVSVTGRDHIKNMSSSLSCMKGVMLDDSLCLILCQANLDFAVLAYLCDAFEEKWQQGKLRSVLRLHHALAPYKVVVTVECGNLVSGRKLSDVCDRLVKEFKKCSLTVLPNPFPSMSSIESQFERFDEMGVPYTVVLSEISLLTGLAGLRNRDTTLQEQVHITELSSKLLTYLQMKISASD